MLMLWLMSCRGVRKGMNGREEQIKGANGETGSLSTTNADAAMTESIDFGFTCKREKKIVHGAMDRRHHRDVRNARGTMKVTLAFLE
jgi:hypothetical protein